MATTSVGGFVALADGRLVARGGDDRRAAREGLGHHHPERLRPADRHQKATGAHEELAAARGAHLAGVRDLLSVEVGGASWLGTSA